MQMNAINWEESTVGRDQSGPYALRRMGRTGAAGAYNRTPAARRGPIDHAHQARAAARCQSTQFFPNSFVHLHMYILFVTFSRILAKWKRVASPSTTANPTWLDALHGSVKKSRLGIQAEELLKVGGSERFAQARGVGCYQHLQVMFDIVIAPVANSCMA